MLVERPMKAYYADEAERDRFRQLKATRPDLDVWGGMGMDLAREKFVPRLHAGTYGLSAETIDPAIAEFTAAALSGFDTMPPHERPSEDERFLFRVAFRSTCCAARDELLAAIYLYEPAAKALIALAGLGKAVAEGVAALQAAAAPHALAARPAPSHRRLRPEDFGALPQPRT